MLQEFHLKTSLYYYYNLILTFPEATSEPVQYHCDYCSKDISNTVRIRCAVCDEFEVCIECFIAGVELKGHQSSHNYRVIDNMHFPFFETSWSADEEYLLLEGLEVC